MIENKKVPEIRFKGFNEEWEQRKLGDIFEYERPDKYIVESDKYNDYSKTPVLTANKAFILGYIDENRTYKKENESIIFDDFTLDTKFVDFPYMVKSSALKILTLKNKNSDNLRFNYELLSKTKFNVLGHARHYISVVQPEEVRTTIKEEQDKISNLMFNLDNLITLQERKYNKLVNIKKSMLDKMFPKNNSKVPEIRFRGFTEDWEQCKLGNLMDVTSVKRILQSDWTESGIRFLRARDIVAEYKNEDIDDKIYISEEKYNEYSLISGKVQLNDLLVTGVGTIGIPYLIMNNKPIYFKDGNVIWFKNNNKINGDFLYYSFTGDKIQRFINEKAGIGTVGTYTIQSGKETPIMLANRNEQIKVSNFMKNLDNLINLQKRKIEKLNNIKKYLLDKMFV